jgi:hypothetical protein
VEETLLQAVLVLQPLPPMYYCNNLRMYGDSPLHLAVLKGRIDIVKYLLKVCLPLPQPLLFPAIKQHWHNPFATATV